MSRFHYLRALNNRRLLEYSVATNHRVYTARRTKTYKYDCGKKRNEIEIYRNNNYCSFDCSWEIGNVEGNFQFTSERDGKTIVAVEQRLREKFGRMCCFFFYRIFVHVHRKFEYIILNISI